MASSDEAAFGESTGQRDAAWVREAIAGDTEAFGHLITTYERRAVAVAYRLLGNRDDAVEVSQEAFLRAYRSLEKLKEPARFGPWLMRIVSNLSLNARRSRKSGTTGALDENQGADGMATGEGGPATTVTFTPDSRMQHREMQAALEEALETLPEKQRLSLVLFTIEGWAQKDIAELLECSLENVKWNVFQARKRLRERLGGLIDM